MKINTLTLNSVQYHYAITHGNTSNTPILFINGAFQNMFSWSTLANQLSKQRTTLVTDLPAWGKADSLKAEVDFEFYADAVDQILRNEEIDKVTIVSTSYGTNIATTFATLFPEKIDKLILTAPLLEISPRLKSFNPRLQELINAKDFTQLFHFLLKIGLLNVHAGECKQIHNYQLVRHCFERQIKTLTAKKLADFQSNTERIMKYGNADLSKIREVETLVLTGVHDTFTDLSSCKSIYNQFVNARFEIVPNADHFFLFERPLYTAQIIERFLIATDSVVNNIVLNRA